MESTSNSVCSKRFRARVNWEQPSFGKCPKENLSIPFRWDGEPKIVDLRELFPIYQIFFFNFILSTRFYAEGIQHMIFVLMPTLKTRVGPVMNMHRDDKEDNHLQLMTSLVLYTEKIDMETSDVIYVFRKL